MVRFRYATALSATLLLSLAATAHAAEPQPTPFKHVGAGSCASGPCHGRTAKAPTGNVWLNEYNVWSGKNDLHSKAYNALGGPLGLKMASLLGKPNDRAACLDCHTDNVPEQMQTLRFAPKGGVTCESCHGGAEKWLDSHVQTGATHADSVSRGLYPLENPTRRAELCLTCHVGSSTKFVTHAMYAAGHPRVGFEVDLFSYSQPYHFDVDVDYKRRKGYFPKINMWVAGQLAATDRYMSLLQSKHLQTGPMAAEFALFECESCHHDTHAIRWSPARDGPNAPVGTLRIRKSSFLTLQSLIKVIGPEQAGTEFLGLRQALMRASQTDVATLRAAAAKLQAWLAAHRSWTTRTFSDAEVSAIRRELLRQATGEESLDYTASEQLVLSVTTLSYAMGDEPAHKGDIDKLNGALTFPWNPQGFASQVRVVQGKF